ncbi:glycosyltransferase family 4 protein [Providencia rettgeri]|uniref:glycosyltransferase family 4 protein n=3 Tax=Providencia TaxID=586 RepID=UPI00255306E3|nr:glycosyltransferase family 4 protein [Providencia rettgeri]
MKNNLSILNIGHNYRITGGSDSYMFYLSELLEEKNINVIPFASANPENIPSEYDVFFPKDNKNLINYIYNKKAKKNLEKLIEKHSEISLAHLHIYYGKLTTAILDALQKNKIPIIQSLHEYKLLCPVYTMLSPTGYCDKCKNNKFYNCITNKCKKNSYLDSIFVTIESYFSRFNGDIKKINHFIAVSYFMKSQMLKTGIPENKITVIHNFVDTQKFSLRESYPSNSYYCYFGRIEKNKGLKTLVDAFIKNGHQLKIAGIGSYKEELLEYCSDNNIENIKFVGQLKNDDLINFITRSTASIIPSEWYENCPMSVLESMSLGVPVIGSNIGGIPELINDNYNGYLFESGNIASLNEAIQKMENSDKINISVQARVSIEENFSKEAHYEKLINCYEQVLNNEKR